jgi:hypothetical protein
VRLKQLSTMQLTREELLMKLGAARDQSRTAWRLAAIEVATDSATFSYRLDRAKLRQARSREGRYLLRTNLVEEDPAKLWSHYLLLVAVEEAFKNLKRDLAIRPIFHRHEPKPVQKPRPPVMIAGGGEQLTLRAVARLADACNVGGDPDTVRHKLTVLRRHCDAAQRDYATIETTHNNSWLLGRDEAAVMAKRERLGERGPLRGFLGTVSKAIDLIGKYQEAGVHLRINSDYRNDIETHELFASDVMPHFA